MNEKCFDIGTIQAFLDGETAQELSFELTDHTAACDKCALMLAEAEDEHSRVYSILDRELNTLVPTQRLWDNISVAIADQTGPSPLWARLRALSIGLFANPSLVAAAGVLMITGIFAMIWSVGERAPGEMFSLSNKTAVENTSVAAGPVPIAPTVPSSEEPAQNTPPVLVRETNHSPEKLRRLVSNATHRPAEGNARPEYLVETYIPGEESYVRTIANLKENVDDRKDMAMTPSSRVAFERDLAVVNDAIDKMKEIVRKDPKNQAAKQVLYSSYQNKIDLLNSVVEREELMASLQ